MKIVVKNARGLSKVKGLIGKKSPQAILLTTRFGIHTFGLRFPIDLAVIDRKDVVQAVRRNFQPNGVFLWSPKYDRILELPQGTLKMRGITKGEMLELKIIE